MNSRIFLLFLLLICPVISDGNEPIVPKSRDSIEVHPVINKQTPMGKPGFAASYRHESTGTIPGSVVRTFTLTLGPIEEKNSRRFQWLHLYATKTNGTPFCTWILTNRYPPARETTARYILRKGATQAIEFCHQFSGEPVLPSLGAWRHLWPRAVNNDLSDDLFATKTRFKSDPGNAT